MNIPKFSIKFDTTALAKNDYDSSLAEENLIKHIIADLNKGNSECESCKIAAKLITPNMFTDQHLLEIFETLIQESNLEYVPAKLGRSKAVFTHLLQITQKENIKYNKTVLMSIIEQIREYFVTREAVKKLKNFENYTIEQMIQAMTTLEKDITTNLKVDKETHPLIVGSLEPEDFSQEIEWLIPDILFPQSVNIFFGPPSQGKSMLAFAIGVELLRRNLIDHLIYLDGDNPLTILKFRKIDQALVKFNIGEKKIIYHSIGTAEVMQKIFESVINFPGRNLIVIDSLKDLAGNLNLNDQRDSTFLQTLIQRVRNGAKNINTNTVVILHHENKNRQAKGNGVFLDGADCSYQFSLSTKQEDSLTIRLVNQKSRLPVKAQFDIKVYFEKYAITEVLSKNNGSNTIQIQEKDKKNIEAIRKYLLGKKRLGVETVSLSEITEALSIPQNVLRGYGKRYDGHFWLFNRQDEFTILDYRRQSNEVDLWTKTAIDIDTIDVEEDHKKIKAIFR